MSTSQTSVTITRRLQFDDKPWSSTALMSPGGFGGVRELALAAQDARESLEDTLRAFWSALMLEQGTRAGADKFKSVRQASKAVRAFFTGFWPPFAAIAVLALALFLAYQCRLSLELQLLIRRSGGKFKTSKEPPLAGGITDTFADIASLDLGVSQLWEKQHELKIAVAMAQDRHEQLKGEQQAQRRSMEVAYATQQIEFNLLYSQLVKKKQALELAKERMKMKFVEMHKNLTESKNRIVRAEIRLHHNLKTIKDANEIVRMNHGVPDEEEGGQ